jgi:hypothetical protein
VKKKNDVAYERIGDLAAEKHFRVRPQDLSGKPERGTTGHKHPEKTSATILIADIQASADQQRKQQNALSRITDRGEKKAVRKHERA